MRFSRKRVAVVGGILAAFALVVGVFAGLTATKGDASAAQEQATVSHSGAWINNWNEYPWQTHNFTLTFDGTAHKSWCGDIMASAPGSGSSWGLNRVSVTNQSPVLFRYLFKAMYYGEGNDFPEFANVSDNEKILAVHFVLGKILSNTTLGYSSNTPAAILYNKVIANEYLPDGIKDAMVYYIDPSGRGTGASYGGTQRIFTFSFNVQESMSVDVRKVWKDHFDSGARQNVSIHVKISVAGSGSVPKRADGSDYTELSNITLDAAHDWSAHFDGLMANQQLQIEELMSESGFYKNDESDTAWRNRDIDDTTYYTNTSPVTCDMAGTLATCTSTNTEVSYTNLRLYTYKQWIDESETRRPDYIYYHIRAFIEVDGGYEDVTDRVGVINPNGYSKAKRPGKDIWAGYISNLPATLPGSDDVPVIYATSEFDASYNDVRIGSVPKNYQVSCGGNNSIQASDGVYCTASTRSDGDVEVYMKNEEILTWLQAKKTWNDGGDVKNKRPTMLLYKIYRDGEYFGTAGMINPRTTGEPDTGVWTVTEELPKYDETGREFVYTYEEFDYNWEWWEDEDDALRADYTWPEGQVSYDSEDGMVNTAITDIPVIKCWLFDEPADRPTALGFDLYAGSTKIDHIDLNGSQKDGDCWTGTFEDLPLFDEDGDKIVYRVEEDETDLTTDDGVYEADFTSCTMDIEERKRKAGDGEIDTSCTFVNRRIELIELPVIKCWLDDSEETRPDKMVFKLYWDYDDYKEEVSTLTLTSKNADGNGCWSGAFYNLPANDLNGYKLTYRVEEDTSNVDSHYEADIEQCEVDVADRKAKAGDGEDVDYRCAFNNRWVEATDTSAQSMRLYYVTIPAVILGGLYITRRAIARK